MKYLSRILQFVIVAATVVSISSCNTSSLNEGTSHSTTEKVQATNAVEEYKSYFDVEAYFDDEMKNAPSYFMSENYVCSYFQDGVCINRYIGNDTNVVIPESINDKRVIKLGAYTEYYESTTEGECYGKGGTYLCTALKAVSATAKITYTLPKYMKYICEGTFSYSLVSEINVHKDNPYYCSDNGVLYTKDMKTLLVFPSGYRRAVYTVPQGVVRIYKSATEFMEKSGLKYLFKLPSSISEIEDLTALPSVEVSSDNKEYASADGSLYNKDKTVLLRCNPFPEKDRVIIKQGVKTIPENCAFGFLTCKDSAIKHIYIPESVETIKADLGMELCRLYEYEVSDKNKFFSCEDGVLFNKDKTEIVAYPSWKKVKEYRIPETVTAVNADLFENAWYKTGTFIIGRNVTEIYGDGMRYKAIKGYKGTAAEKFAKENDLNFIPQK